MQPVAARIRRARPGEAPALTDLMRRSKAHWGYDPDVMAAVAEDLSLTAEEVAADEVWVLEDTESAAIGLYRIVRGQPPTLADLWLEPSAIGRGNGRRLWEHALDNARSLGARAVELDADPHAVGFYERLGARRIGETLSPAIPGRKLPRMRIELR